MTERAQRIAANSAGLLAGMIQVWDLVDRSDFHPEYWIAQAKATLAGRPIRKMKAPRSMLRRIRAQEAKKA